jgi:uncharacterized protein involved in outer membrane biogenesis
MKEGQTGTTSRMKSFLIILGKILVVLACIGALLFISRNFIARKSVEMGVRTVTGFPMTIKEVNLASNLSSLDASDMRMLNPQSEYSAPHFITISKLHMEFEPISMVKRSPHIKVMTLDIPKISIVRSNQGVYNVMKLKPITDINNPMPNDGRPSNYQLDQLSITLGTVVVEDFTRDQHTVKEFAVNKTVKFSGLTNPGDIAQAILMIVLTSPDVKVPDLGLKMENLKTGVGKAVDNAVKGIAIPKPK